jgi:hypothetical protein
MVIHLLIMPWMTLIAMRIVVSITITHEIDAKIILSTASYLICSLFNVISIEIVLLLVFLHIVAF